MQECLRTRLDHAGQSPKIPQSKPAAERGPTVASGMRRVLLRDVAREADVFLKTASSVLNGEPHVLEETALRVRDAMDRLGYRPNELARSLKARRSGVVGVVVPLLTHEDVAGCVEAIHHSLQESGKTVLLMLSGGNHETARQQIQLMLQRHVEGLILLNPLQALSRSLATKSAKSQQ